jgi:hypothetical protein
MLGAGLGAELGFASLRRVRSGSVRVVDQLALTW